MVEKDRLPGGVRNAENFSGKELFKQTFVSREKIECLDTVLKVFMKKFTPKKGL